MGELFERAWPVADAKAAVVVVHGLAEHSGRYDGVARALNAAGYAVYAQDLRGHGRSVGFPGDMGDDLDRVVADIVEFCTRVRAAHETVFLLAHSLGTMLSIPAVARTPSGTLKGLILSGTAIVPGPAFADLAAKGTIPASVLSRDPEVVKAYEDDPLVFKRVPGELLVLLSGLDQRVRSAIPNISIPVLLIHGTEDQLCSLEGANYVWIQLILVDKVLQGYRGLYHEVLNEPEKDQVVKDVVGWLDAHRA